MVVHCGLGGFLVGHEYRICFPSTSLQTLHSSCWGKLPQAISNNNRLQHVGGPFRNFKQISCNLTSGTLRQWCWSYWLWCRSRSNQLERITATNQFLYLFVHVWPPYLLPQSRLRSHYTLMPLMGQLNLSPLFLWHNNSGFSHNQVSFHPQFISNSFVVSSLEPRLITTSLGLTNQLEGCAQLRLSLNLVG